MKTVQWGIIGCGDVTEKKSGPAFNKVNHSRLVAVMRRDKEKAKDYADRHGVAKWYVDAEDLINDPEVNAIYIATPPLYHEEYTIRALRAGKPVYVEKPMAVNASGAENMMNASRATATKLSVAHYRREQPLFKKVKSLIENGAIGTVRLANLQFLQTPQTNGKESVVNWRVDPMIAGGGLFHDLSPHQLDLMIYFFGVPVKACGIALNQAGLYIADDAVTGHIKFESGVLFNGLWCFTVPPQMATDACEIIGSEGTIRFSIFKHDDVVLNRNGEIEVFRFSALQHVQQPMIESVVRYFIDEATNPCSAEAGIQTMRMIDIFTKNNGQE
jgi:predicted dehydrogenase